MGSSKGRESTLFVIFASETKDWSKDWVILWNQDAAHLLVVLECFRLFNELFNESMLFF